MSCEQHAASSQQQKTAAGVHTLWNELQNIVFATVSAEISNSSQGQSHTSEGSASNTAPMDVSRQPAEVEDDTSKDQVLAAEGKAAEVKQQDTTSVTSGASSSASAMTSSRPPVRTACKGMLQEKMPTFWMPWRLAKLLLRGCFPVLISAHRMATSGNHHPWYVLAPRSC